jgi:2-keto-4-pentenoate hydratase/2-oxohepta-3-ene-1,7-dioic acid hydratase in catechol pathway
MRRVRFRDTAGYVRTGEWTDSGIECAGTRFDPDKVDLFSPVEPSKIICVARNYRDGIDDEAEVPDRPILFLKSPNAVAAHGNEIPLPSAEEVLFEGEIGVVIREQCRNVDRSEAMDVVMGFTCGNDISNRSDENMLRRKAFDNAAPLGPVVATPDEVPADAAIEVRVNGALRQSSSREQFVFSVPELIEHISTYQTLERGDVILTGSPPGMGPLSDGDRVEISVEGVGTLEHEVSLPEQGWSDRNHRGTD